MKKHIMILLLTTVGLSAQKIVTKYNNYMYSGTPAFIWWDQVKEFPDPFVGGPSNHENSAPARQKNGWDYTYDEIPLPYFYDKNFKRNYYIKEQSRMNIESHSLSSARMIGELGRPKSATFNKASSYTKAFHVMTYRWFGNQRDERKYIYFGKSAREVFGVKAVLVKTEGDFTANNAITARRSKWIVTDAMLVLVKVRKPTDCWMNICNPAFPCPGHGLSHEEKVGIAMARTTQQQGYLSLGYAKRLESKFAKGEKMKRHLLNESKWYLRKGGALGHTVAIVRK